MYKHYLTWYATLFFVLFQPHLFRPQWERELSRGGEKKKPKKVEKIESISKRSPFRHYEGADSSPTPHSDSVQDLWQMALYSRYCWFAAIKRHSCFVFTNSWKFLFHSNVLLNCYSLFMYRIPFQRVNCCNEMNPS